MELSNRLMVEWWSCRGVEPSNRRMVEWWVSEVGGIVESLNSRIVESSNGGLVELVELSIRLVVK